jgi:hypothetical protein
MIDTIAIIYSEKNPITPNPDVASVPIYSLINLHMQYIMNDAPITVSVIITSDFYRW